MRIERIRLGWPNVWLIGHNGRWIVVDAGYRRTSERLIMGIEKAGCALKDIALIVVTHVHYDHAGGACALSRAAGAPVATSAADADAMRAGGFSLSPGLHVVGHVKYFIGTRLVPRANFAFDGCRPEITVEGEYSLRELGFPAILVESPGHTSGSISLLTDAGDLFAGDLAITQPLPGIWRHMPVYGSSVSEIKATWRAMIARGVRRIYPGHGRDFPVSEIMRYI